MFPVKTDKADSHRVTEARRKPDQEKYPRGGLKINLTLSQIGSHIHTAL
jgi:hypothetical protein